MKTKKIDKIDKKIIYALDSLGFYSLGDIASFARISKQNVGYRLNKLTTMNILNGYSVEMNLSKLGIMLGRLYLKFSGSRAKNTNWLFERLGNRLLYLWSATGEFDTFLAFDVLKEGRQIAALLQDEFAGSILRSRFAVFSDVQSLDRAYLLEKQPSKSWQFINFLEKPHSLPDKSKNVLSHLLAHSNSRQLPLNMAHLAAATGLDVRTVKKALSYLKKEGVFQRIRPIINLRELGVNHYKIDVRLSNKADRATISKMEKDVYWAQGSVYINKVVGAEPAIEGEFETTPGGFDALIEMLEENYSDSIEEIRQMVYRKQLITTSFRSFAPAV